MYVGITRAEHSLQVSYCNRRKRGKDWMVCEPSRFLEEMPEDELVYAGGHADAVPTVTKDLTDSRDLISRRCFWIEDQKTLDKKAKNK